MHRIFFLLFVWLMIVMPVFSQTDPDATIGAINYVIRNINPTKGADRLVEDLCKKFKNNPKVLVGIGEAYYQAGDSGCAKRFFRRSIELHPQYVPAYIAAGDWARDRYVNYDESIMWYDKAIRVNPRDTTAYIRYARILTLQNKPEAAASKIKEISSYVPNFPVNLEIARVYSNLGKIEEAISYYGKEKMENLPLSDLIEYATICYLTSKNDTAIKVVNFAREKYPRSHQIYRVGLLALQKAEDYKGAIDCGEHLLYQTDNPSIIIEDYYNLANCYNKLKKGEKSIELYRKVIDFPLEDPNDTKAKDNKQRMCDNAYQNIAQIYVDNGEWEKAYTTYQEYYDLRKAEGRPSAYVLGLHALAYMYQADEENGENKVQCYLAANRIYEKLLKEFPDNANIALENIINNFNRMDPKAEKGLAKPYAEQLLTILNAKEKPLSDDDLRRLKLVNLYLAYYYYITKDDKKTSLPYWRKVHELDPEDSNAKLVLGIK